MGRDRRWKLEVYACEGTAYFDHVLREDGSNISGDFVTRTELLKARGGARDCQTGFLYLDVCLLSSVFTFVFAHIFNSDSRCLQAAIGRGSKI